MACTVRYARVLRRVTPEDDTFFRLDFSPGLVPVLSVETSHRDIFMYAVFWNYRVFPGEKLIFEKILGGDGGGELSAVTYGIMQQVTSQYSVV